MSSNPMLKIRNMDDFVLNEEPMSISGTANKSMILTALVALSGYYVWNLCATGFMDKAGLLTIVGLVASIILFIVAMIKPQFSKITAPMYALCEGLMLGSISYSYGAMFDGIVLNAILITLLVLFVMLFLYRTRMIVATPTFRKVVITSTFAIGIFYLVGLVASLFGHPMTIFNGGLIGIGISLIICGVAALNFIIDFDNIENFANHNMPKYFEWYFAISILVTLVWLYLEVLRLLAQLSMRKD